MVVYHWSFIDIMKKMLQKLTVFVMKMMTENIIQMESSLKIVGFDANALYLWCLGKEIPCGRLI